jgi:hypothetical protein
MPQIQKESFYNIDGRERFRKDPPADIIVKQKEDVSYTLCIESYRFRFSINFHPMIHESSIFMHQHPYQVRIPAVPLVAHIIIKLKNVDAVIL